LNFKGVFRNKNERKKNMKEKWKNWRKSLEERIVTEGNKYEK